MTKICLVFEVQLEEKKSRILIESRLSRAPAYLTSHFIDDELNPRKTK